MTTRTITLPVVHAYALARRVMETRIWERKTRAPWRHGADIASELLQQSPLLARVYVAGMAAGLPSEFQKPRRVRTRRDRLWQRIEAEGRARVAQSPRPLTLRAAVIEVVRERPEWYRAYARAPRG